MALKVLNHEFKAISSGSAPYSTEDEAHLHCLLKETITKSTSDDFINVIQELPLAIHNLQQVIGKCDPKSGPFGKAVELIEKMILSLRNERDVLQNMPFLFILSDILLRSPSRTEYILKLIQDVSFGIRTKSCHVFQDRLIKFCVDIICNESDTHLVKIKLIALSVLINLCNKNPVALTLLEHEINLIDFQKKIPMDTYGILTCKMCLVLNECGHILRDSDTKELHRISMLDEKTLKHLIEFIRDTSELSITKSILQQYDFSLGIRSAIMTLEAVDNQNAIHTTSLFEIIKIVLSSKNTSLNNLINTITNFAIKRIRSPECCVQALETLTTIFDNDTKISSNHFELDELQEISKAILFSSDRKSNVLAPLFKLLNALAKLYKVNLMKTQVVESIFSPLLKVQRPKYFKIPIGDIMMYLECLDLLSTLHENQTFETKPNIFQETNVQFLVAMSIKHGNKDQCALALSLMRRFSNRNISEMISANDYFTEMNDANHLACANQKYAKNNIIKEFGAERIDAATSDFIDLYTNENARLKINIERLEEKYESASKAANEAKSHISQLEITSMKWSEFAQNLQRSNQTLNAENEKLNTIITSLRSKYKSVMHENDDAIQKLAQEKTVAAKMNKEMEEKVQSFEVELKETEDMRQTILSLMSKRKKTSKD